MNPNIMLFDEPTSALDPEMIKEVLDTMIKLAGSGMIMICMTHEMGFAKKVANRVIFMDGDEILEQNEPLEFFNNPQNDRTQALPESDVGALGDLRLRKQLIDNPQRLAFVTTTEQVQVVEDVIQVYIASCGFCTPGREAMPRYKHHKNGCQNCQTAQSWPSPPPDLRNRLPGRR